MSQDNQTKDDNPKIPKKSLTNNTAKRAIGLGGTQADFFEQRNSLIPDKEAELEQLIAEFAGYAENQDTSDVTDVQTNQAEILKEISGLLKENKDERGIFEAVKTLFSKQDIKWTDQLNKIGLRLVRLFEIQRTGTTDVVSFSNTKDILKEHGFDLLKYYKGNDKQKAVFILKNVENSQTGTTQIGLSELEETRDMVQAALRDELVGKYQKPADPQELEGPQGDIKLIKTDVSPKVILYLRLFESLSIAIIKQQEITIENRSGLEQKKQEVLNSLDSLATLPGIVVTTEMRAEFIGRMSIMTLDALKYFNYKILYLFNSYKRNLVDANTANWEINGWFDKKFDHTELHNELEEMKAENQAQKEKELEALRSGKLVEFPIKNSVHTPIRPGDKKLAA
jgi:hypothetical protein